MKFKCKCGTDSKEFQYSSNLGENQEESGFGFVWDISNGLSAIWMCMNCRDEITEAWNKIVEIASTEFIQIPKFRKK